MNQYSFSKITISRELKSNATRFEISANKPLYCPLCSTPQDGILKDGKYYSRVNNLYYVTFSYECSVCRNTYLTIYDVDCDNKKAEFEAFHPSIFPGYFDDKLSKISERFIDMYNQALTCENSNHIELAAIGYRSSLEYLIKDYAINELNEDKKSVGRMSLFDATSRFLDPECVKSADVIRILGNDYTHFERKYPEYDFEILKAYMEIFIQQIRTKYMISHPPVARSGDQS